MRLRAALFLLGWVMLGGPGLATAQDEPLQQALALQKVMQKVIADVEPGIACVLVSRSEAYARVGQAPTLDHSGRLGGFDADALDQLPLMKEERERLRKKLDLADPNAVPEAFGSGVVVDAQGLVLTNYHVVQGAAKVFVRFPGGKGSYADMHAADPRSDLAVLRVLNPSLLPLQPLSLGDGGKLQRGQFILSLANPFAAGFRDGQPSASWGIISNVRRRASGLKREEDAVKSLHQYGTLLQLDARLHLGCSGGALVNLQGELVGLTTAWAAIHGGETPGGFAVPLDAGMRRILTVLKRGEEVEYGFLGVGPQDRPVDQGDGILLTHVMPGSPAEKEAKLRIHDVLLSINGTPLRDSDDLFLALGTQLAGATVRLEVRRAPGGTSTVQATLVKFHVAGKKVYSSLGSRPFFRGLRVDYTSLLVQQKPALLRIPVGVLVAEVAPNSQAATAQLKPGEIITHVNGRPVATPAGFYAMTLGQGAAVELTLASLAPNDPPTKVILQ